MTEIYFFENPNPDSCFYFNAANSLLKQESPTSCKIEKKRKNSVEEKLADLAPLSSDKSEKSTRKRPGN